MAHSTKPWQGSPRVLLRARRPFMVKNTLTGLGLLTLTGYIYWYTLRVVGQDNFEDVKVPQEPRQPPKTT